MRHCPHRVSSGRYRRSCYVSILGRLNVHPVLKSEPPPPPPPRPVASMLLPAGERKTCRRLCFHVMLLCLCSLWSRPSPSFGLGQDPSKLRLLREETGMNLRTRINNPNMTYSKEARRLLSRIGEARDRGDWHYVKRLFQKYDGKELPVFHAVLHTAFSCGQYKEGAAIYLRLTNLNITQDGAAYATALKLFAKLGHTSRVREIWREARSSCPLDEPLAAARGLND